VNLLYQKTSIKIKIKNKSYIIAVEHDLSILDYLSDYVCLLYGSATHYGVVTSTSTAANGKKLLKRENLV
jgi:ATP-binding cassette subfamily E protein 1